VHSLVRRTLENLQDVVATLLLLLLLVLSLQALWRLARMALVGEATAQLLSEIVFVLILTEVYRLMIYYLREHRISVALTVEVALVSTLRELMLKGAHDFEGLRLVGISLLLVVLGGLLALERWTGYWRIEERETDAH
ncbi:MAG: phosphate-starvation-inducible PsiE family protein, partial [Isosphaeraceae bacterium]